MIAAMAAMCLIPRALFDVTQFGAVGDGKTIATSAVQTAIDEAARVKGTVVIPQGDYLIGSVHLRSNVELHLDAGATLLGSPKRKDYEKGAWYALILASKANHIAITGAGTIDGQGARVAQDVLALVETGEVKIPPKGWRPNATDRPQIIEIDECKGVRIEGVTIKNAACWVQTYRRCKDLEIKGIKVDSKTYWNNDGIDVVDCRKVRIADCDVDSDDDGICLKSESRNSMCENVLIENCRVRSSASAVKFGTASQGGFRNIVVRGLSIRDTFRSVVALESVDGGILEDVLVENIKATSTGNAFFIRLGHRNMKVPVGRVRHVTLRDIDVQVPAGRPDEGYPFHGPQFAEPHNVNPSSIVGHAQVPIEDVRLERITLRMPGGGSPKVAFVPLDHLDRVPERAQEYPEFSNFGELPAWAVYIRHVRGLTIKDLLVTLEQADYRPAFVADDVAALAAHSLKVEGADRNPTIALRNARDIAIGSGVKVKVVGVKVRK